MLCNSICFYYLLGVIFKNFFNWIVAGSWLLLKLLHVHCRFVLFANFGARDTWMRVLNTALEFFFFLAIDDGNPKTDIHLDALIGLRVEKYHVVPLDILVSGLLFKELARKNTDVNVWACQHFYTTRLLGRNLTSQVDCQWTSHRKVCFQVRAWVHRCSFWSSWTCLY